jgi:hypothetical protein
MPAQVKSMAAALALKEARLILKTRARGDVLWKTRIRHEWQTDLKRPVLLELLSNGDLRVTDTKTREIITQGPAWVPNGCEGVRPL